MIIIDQDKINIYTKTIRPTSYKNRKMYKMVIPIIALAILIGYIYFDLNFTKVQYVDIKSDKVQGEDKLKILQISDFHDSK